LTATQSVIMLPKKNRLRVYVDGDMKYYRLRELKRSLASVVVKGVPSLHRAIINIKDKNDARGQKGDKELLIEGYGLQKVMTTEGIIGEFTTSNHVIEVQKVLGIEAARQTIINEIQFTMREHGMNIDPR
jgi:DNA-directed RNA polymerase III subunit RPC1